MTDVLPLAVVACSGCFQGAGGAAWAYRAVTVGMVLVPLVAVALFARWVAAQEALTPP